MPFGIGRRLVFRVDPREGREENRRVATVRANGPAVSWEWEIGMMPTG